MILGFCDEFDATLMNDRGRWNLPWPTTGLNPQRVQVLDLLVERQEQRPRLPDDYAIPGVSENVVRIILSYTA